MCLWDKSIRGAALSLCSTTLLSSPYQSMVVILVFRVRPTAPDVYSPMTANFLTPSVKRCYLLCQGY